MNSISINKKQIRKFGVIALIFFGSLCGLGIWKEKLFPIYFFGLLGIIGLGFIIAPSPLRPVYKGWLKVAHFLGIAVNTVILALAYYFVITPSGLIKRLFGGRPLPIKPDRRASTYWVKRNEPIQSKEQFQKRF